MGAVAGYDSWRLKGAQPFRLDLDYNSLKQNLTWTEKSDILIPSKERNKKNVYLA